MSNSVSHNSDDSSNGQSGILACNMCTLGRNDHDNNTNVPSLEYHNYRGTKCDVVYIKGVFVARG
jgi:hypothetical protein